MTLLRKIIRPKRTSVEPLTPIAYAVPNTMSPPRHYYIRNHSHSVMYRLCTWNCKGKDIPVTGREGP
jgi:hypothetical protein